MRFPPIISSVQSKEALDRPCYGVYQTCFEVVVFGSHGPAFVFTGYEAEYRVCDAGALRAEPLVPLYLARSNISAGDTLGRWGLRLPKSTF